jgi:AcrR family transcriptional regulator
MSIIDSVMAHVNPVRRAEIGREKRARTQAQLVAAATKLFAKRAVESVTVDDVVKEAGLAKGTFYVHFEDLRALTAAVAEELVKSFDDLLQPVRLSLRDPAVRIAFGCSCFIDKALADPGWAGVVVRMVAAVPTGGELARHRLFEDLRSLSRGLPRGSISAHLSLEIVVGIMIQLLGAFGEGRLTSRDRETAIDAILRAIGIDASQTKNVLERIPARQNVLLAAGKEPASRRPRAADDQT